MKKIVALVLSLVMVLGLATTAFAAKAFTPTEMGSVVAGNTDLAGWDAKLELADKETDDEFAVYTVLLTAKKDCTYAGKDYDAGDDMDLWNSYGGDEFVIVDGTGSYDWAIVDGKKVTYLAAYEAYEDLGWETKATAATDLALMPNAAADMKCDSYYFTSVADLGTTFFWYEDALYAPCADADMEYIFNVGGVAVKVAEVAVADTYFDTLNNDRVIYVNHNYVVEYKGSGYGSETDTKVFCDACKAEFKFVAGPEVVAVATFGEGNYFALDTGLWVAYEASAAAGSDAVAGDKVESAETFDAGIAMYVGMSVMAAAGSAVVLKKKD